MSVRIGLLPLFNRCNPDKLYCPRVILSRGSKLDIICFHFFFTNRFPRLPVKLSNILSFIGMP